MADILRLVTIAAGQRPVVVRNYDDQTSVGKMAGTFAINAPARSTVNSAPSRRYAGGWAIGETHDNGTITWDALVLGATADLANAAIENMIADLETYQPLQPYYVEFRPDGATASTFYEVRGPATWTPKYQWNLFAGARGWIATISIPVAPLAQMEQMDTVDRFVIDSSADYGFDAGANTTDMVFGNGQITPAGTLTTERRIYHNAKGYLVQDLQTTVKGVVGTTTTGFKLGANIRITSALTIDAYLDDDGTNSRIRIDTLQNQVTRFNRATGNLISRIVAGQTVWVRVKREGSGPVAVEVFFSPPSLASPVVASTTWLQPVGWTGAGAGGISWIPQSSNAAILEFEHLPFTYSTIPFLPIAPVDKTDDFSTDTIVAAPLYTIAAGSGTMAVSGGVVTFSTTAEKRFFVTNGQWVNTQVTIKMNISGSNVGGQIGVILKHTSVGDDIIANWDTQNGTLGVYRLNGGVMNALGPTVNAGSAVTSIPYWVRGKIRENQFEAEVWVTDPATPGANPISKVFGQFTETQAANNGGAGFQGPPGVRVIPASTTWTMDDFAVVTLGGPQEILPDAFTLNDNIPGTAPALVDIAVATHSVPNPPAWAAFGWNEAPAPHNMMYNGSFELGTTPWVTTAITQVQAAGTAGLTRVKTNLAKYGFWAGQHSPSATINSGAAVKIYHRLKVGHTYTAKAWQWHPSSTSSMLLGAGYPSNFTRGTAVALSPTPTAVTVTFVALSDADYFYVSHQTSAATAITNVQLDGVMVWEGTAAQAPTNPRQIAGDGAFAPFGVFPSIDSDPTYKLGSWATATDVVAGRISRFGTMYVDSAVSGSESYQVGWWVDPSVMTPDAFRGDLDIEIWARVYLSSTLTTPLGSNCFARPEVGPGYFGPPRYTNEYGSSSTKVFPIPSSGSQFRMMRMGTITFPVDPDNSGRWLFTFSASVTSLSSGTFGLDYVVLMPSNSRVLGPTGKTQDSTYPTFIRDSSDQAKTITSDMRGVIQRPGYQGSYDAGMGGVPIEFPSGKVAVVANMSNLVPDDPTANANSSDPYWPTTLHFAVTPRINLVR
jgi:hypothetical protein